MNNQSHFPSHNSQTSHPNPIAYNRSPNF